MRVTLRAATTLGLLLVGLTALAVPDTATAGPLDKLTPDERRAVETCQKLIRARHLTDGTARGAFRMATNTREAWIEHYFVLEAMLALLAAADGPDSDDVKLVGGYLTFYAKDAATHSQGVAHNFDGPLLAPKHLTRVKNKKGGWDNKDFDSIDSYSGLYLLVAARYYKLTGTLPEGSRGCVLLSLKALDRVINDKPGVVRDAGESTVFAGGAATNGLPIARGEYPIHQLIDAVEAHAGLRESVDLFRKLSLSKEAARADALAAGIVKGVALFGPDPKRGRYACKIDNGNNPVYDSRPYPGDFADLFALSYFSGADSKVRAAMWNRLDGARKPGTFPREIPAERWLIAAARIEPDKAKVASLRKVVADQAVGFNHETYIDRPAFTILALLGEPAHFPLVR